ncbi:hypothetical protein BJ508DRAFT_331169 [Ascobolus immersus RN42]|uniref:Uncharacterized protein n=1 Tax=Ascobolus immersus RN42 TaxID=1160509 RepID=A0A3N4HRC9_ASCIM|nr:hypothetical protein BJ508DRAFT_331169 [Ascobolus immersus RN42]
MGILHRSKSHKDLKPTHSPDPLPVRPPTSSSAQRTRTATTSSESSSSRSYTPPTTSGSTTSPEKLRHDDFDAPALPRTVTAPPEKTIKRSRSILQLGLRRAERREERLERELERKEKEKEGQQQKSVPKTPKTPKFSLSPFPAASNPSLPHASAQPSFDLGRMEKSFDVPRQPQPLRGVKPSLDIPRNDRPRVLPRNKSIEALRTPASEIGLAIGSPSDHGKRKEYFQPQSTPMGINTPDTYGFSTSISSGPATPYTPATIPQESGWRRLFGKGLFSKKGGKKLVKANPPANVSRNASGQNSPITQSSNSSNVSVEQPKRPEIQRTDSGQSMRLEVDIPAVEMERYSVMFGPVLLPKRNGSLYARRRSRFVNTSPDTSSPSSPTEEPRLLLPLPNTQALKRNATTGQLQSRSPLLPYYQGVPGVATPVRLSRIGMAVTTPTQHPITPQFYSSSTSNLALPSAGLGGYSPGDSPARPESATFFQRESMLPAVAMMRRDQEEERRNSEIERFERELEAQEEMCAKQRERLSELTIKATVSDEERIEVEQQEEENVRDLTPDERLAEALRMEEEDDEAEDVVTGEVRTTVFEYTGLAPPSRGERHLSQIPTPALSPLPMTQYTAFQPAPASPPASTSVSVSAPAESGKTLQLPARDIDNIPTPALSPLPMTQYRDPYQYQPLSPEVLSPVSPPVVGSPLAFTNNPFTSSPIDTSTSDRTASIASSHEASRTSSRTSYEPHDDTFLFSPSPTSTGVPSPYFSRPPSHPTSANTTPPPPPLVRPAKPEPKPEPPANETPAQRALREKAMQSLSRQVSQSKQQLFIPGVIKVVPVKSPVSSPTLTSPVLSPLSRSRPTTPRTPTFRVPGRISEDREREEESEKEIRIRESLLSSPGSDGRPPLAGRQSEEAVIGVASTGLVRRGTGRVVRNEVCNGKRGVEARGSLVDA